MPRRVRRNHVQREPEEALEPQPRGPLENSPARVAFGSTRMRGSEPAQSRDTV